VRVIVAMWLLFLCWLVVGCCLSLSTSCHMRYERSGAALAARGRRGRPPRLAADDVGCGLWAVEASQQSAPRLRFRLDLEMIRKAVGRGPPFLVSRARAPTPTKDDAGFCSCFESARPRRLKKRALKIKELSKRPRPRAKASHRASGSEVRPRSVRDERPSRSCPAQPVASRVLRYSTATA
jgi:hypothetical protein